MYIRHTSCVESICVAVTGNCCRRQQSPRNTSSASIASFIYKVIRNAHNSWSWVFIATTNDRVQHKHADDNENYKKAEKAIKHGKSIALIFKTTKRQIAALNFEVNIDEYFACEVCYLCMTSLVPYLCLFRRHVDVLKASSLREVLYN